MHQWTKIMVLVAAAVFVAEAAISQPAEGRGRFEGRGGFGGFNPPDPSGIVIMAALDADKDGTLSANEIANATAALKKLDKNGDGKVGQEEIRMRLEEIRPPRRERGGRRGGSFGGFDRENFLNQIMEHDKNADGKVSVKELPERMARLMRADRNGDGLLERSELQALFQNSGNRGGGPGGRGNRPQRPARPE